MKNDPTINITDSENPELNQAQAPPSEEEMANQAKRRAEVMEINREQVAALNVNNAGALSVLLANILTEFVDPDNGMVKKHPVKTEVEKINRLAQAAESAFTGSFN